MKDRIAFFNICIRRTGKIQKIEVAKGYAALGYCTDYRVPLNFRQDAHGQSLALPGSAWRQLAALMPVLGLDFDAERCQLKETGA